MGNVQQLSDRFDRIHERLVALEETLKDCPSTAIEANTTGSVPSKYQTLNGFTQSSEKDITPNEARLTGILHSKGFTTFRFVRTPKDYYERSLEFRMGCVGAPSMNHLCKSMIMVNTKAGPDVVDCSSRKNSKYYMVILQYTDDRTHGEKLKNFLYGINEGKVSRKSINMRLAPGDVSDALSGYKHNAVTPFGCKTEIPIILSHNVAALQPPVFFAGAGEVDLKVCVRLDEFIEKYNPFVVDCTYGCT